MHLHRRDHAGPGRRGLDALRRYPTRLFDRWEDALVDQAGLPPGRSRRQRRTLARTSESGKIVRVAQPRRDQQAMLSADVKDVAAVLADFGLQRSPLATARALLVAAWHPEETPDEQDDYNEKHDDDRDRHPSLASVRFAPSTERTIPPRIGGVARGNPIAVIRELGGDRRAPARGSGQRRR